MEQFTFTGKQKAFSAGLMLVGVFATVIGIFTAEEGSHQARVWTNILHNSVFFTGIGFISLFLLCAQITAYSGWHTVYKRVQEAMMMFLPVGTILMLIIAAGIWLHMHHLYHWADAEVVANDVILQGKSGFLNPMVYTLATIGIPLVWILFAFVIRKRSVNEDSTEGLANYKSTKVWAAAFLPIGGFSSAFAIWFWVMSLDPHWYSTMFAWYATASWLVSAVAITVLMIIYLQSKGLMSGVTPEHLHDLGKYLFGFSIFWTYLWFSQFMLIWYANVGEETVYFQLRMDEFPFLFFANLVLNFALPLLILMRNSTKRKIGTLSFMAIVLLFGHWLDFFQMIKPGVWYELQHAAHAGGEHAHHGVQAGFHYPDLIDFGMLAGFAGLFIFVVFSALSRASLAPKNDPYFEESLHHHV